MCIIFTCIFTLAHTHTHTYWYRPSTVDLFFLQEFYTQTLTYTSEFSRITTDFFFVCMNSNYLTMDYPLPPHKSIVGTFIYTHAYAICYRLTVV